MGGQAVVGVLGVPVDATLALQIGYGPRELDDYSIDCMNAAVAAGSSACLESGACTRLIA